NVLGALGVIGISSVRGSTEDLSSYLRSRLLDLQSWRIAATEVLGLTGQAEAGEITGAISKLKGERDAAKHSNEIHCRAADLTDIEVRDRAIRILQALGAHVPDHEVPLQLLARAEEK